MKDVRTHRRNKTGSKRRGRETSMRANGAAAASRADAMDKAARRRNALTLRASVEWWVGSGGALEQTLAHVCVARVGTPCSESPQASPGWQTGGVSPGWPSCPVAHALDDCSELVKLNEPVNECVFEPVSERGLALWASASSHSQVLDTCSLIELLREKLSLGAGSRQGRVYPSNGIPGRLRSVYTERKVRLKDKPEFKD